MKYRWGFLESGVFTECKPIIEDDTALDFSQQSNEIFYRAKINGSLAFRFEFEDILAKGYNYEHVIVLQWYDAANDEWKECWKGRFCLTDCEIDFDTNTITVQPETQDRYTKILDHLEDEYNLLKINPTQQPVTMQIRPIVQLYSIGSGKVTNITSNGYYEQDVNTVAPQIYDYFMQHSHATGDGAFYFAVPVDANGANYFCMPKAACTLWVQDMNDTNYFFFGYFPLDSTNETETTINDAQIYTYDALTGTKTLIETITAKCFYDTSNRDTYFSFRYNNYDYEVHYETEEIGADTPYSYRLPTGWGFVKARANQFVSRILLHTDATTVTIDGRIAPAIPLDQVNDIAPIANYNKIVPLDVTDIFAQAEFQTEVTQYGLADQEGYFVKYNDGTTNYFRPVNISEWCLHSMWAFPLDKGQDAYTQPLTIRDCYTLPSVIFRLMKKADVMINFVDNPTYSEFLFGNDNHITETAFYLCLTPRSNIISSYYDSPALNAPITLAAVFNMLKSLYQVYWYIDENNYLHFEHISYFDNGYSYTEGEPALLVDLEAHTHTRTKSNKAFGQNKIKFEKSNMPQQYKFSFDDKQTIPFDGYPLKCEDNYIQKGQIEEKTIGKFDVDVDYILATPNEFSKEGFVLLACPYVGGVRNFDLGIKKNIRIVDEEGDAYTYNLQNYDCAVAFIQKYWWRYALPCENVNINNESETAITTGKFKDQAIEFADELMAEVLQDVSNANKTIRTQQGDGKIKNISINLNSLAAKGDLLFDFIGRWYYLKGTALGNSISISINGETITISVSNNVFKYKYKEPIAALTFDAADVVSVNFADCDSLDNLTSTQNMFKNCTELVAVDFANKKLAAVTDATDMFTGCANLTTLICPQTSTWHPDISFEDCPALTLDSVYSLIEYLFVYESGAHIITFNQTWWDALDAETQTDIETKANAKGWQIGMAAAYYITGYSAANTVYATINGNAVEIPVTAGAFSYNYRNPITSISFEGDGDVTDIDFSLSDGLASVTSLNNAFKDCVGLTSVVFTNCDLSNIATASDAFANCGALYTLTLPANSWQPDLDLSDTVIMYAEMSNVVSGLYNYSSGVHNITFNSTIWDSLTQAQQQIIFDAASLKYWTTNAVAVVYYIRGKSTAASETFTLQFIQFGSLTPDVAETISVNVDGNGDWECQYINKKIYSLNATWYNKQTITSLDFSNADDMLSCVDMAQAFQRCYALTSINLSGKTLANVVDCSEAFNGLTAMPTINLHDATFASVTNTFAMFSIALSEVGNLVTTSIDLSNATFANATDVSFMFYQQTHLTTLLMPISTFASVTDVSSMFRLTKISTLTLPSATFASVNDATEMFRESDIQTISLPYAIFGNTTIGKSMFYKTKTETLNLPLATFASVTDAEQMFNENYKLATIELPSATFASVTNALGMFSISGAGAGQVVTTLIDLSNATFANVTNMRRFIGNQRKLQTLKIDSATFASVTNSQEWAYYCNLLANVTTSEGATMPSLSATASDTPMPMQACPLTYASMLSLAKLVRDLTGYSAHTCTFKASAWNALSTAEQNNIDSILSGKNWTRAIA